MNVGQASAELFKALGVQPAATAARSKPPRRGRTARRRRFCRTRSGRSAFGGNAAVVGSQVEIERRPAHHRRHHAAAFRRRRQRIESCGCRCRSNPANRQNRGSHFLYLIGRLADGATLDSAKAELETLLAGWPSVDRAAPADRASACTRRTPRTIGCGSIRCRCRSSAARGPRCSCCRARSCSCC